MPAKGAEVSALVPVESDVLVIGAGVIGLSIAWRAAQQGLSVIVADPEPGQGATHAAAGMLTPIAEAAYAEREIFTLGVDSLRRYPGFISELHDLTRLPTGFRQNGTLQVAYDSDDVEMLAETRALQESFGVHLEQLTARDCREAEPLLDPSVRGGLLAPGDGSVDPRLLAAALLQAARMAGAQLVRQSVAEVTCVAGRASGARLADDSVLASRWVVLAAGCRPGLRRRCARSRARLSGCGRAQQRSGPGCRPACCAEPSAARSAGRPCTWCRATAASS
jgi:glycine oxidase